MPIIKARRGKAKLRLGLVGPPKHGKSRTALIIATGLIEKLRDLGQLEGNGRICVIDTERRSSEKYAMAEGETLENLREDAYDFDVLHMERPYTPEKYIDALREIAKEKYSVVIIDQISHVWSGSGGILESVSEATEASSSKNSFIAWGPNGKRHDAFIESYLAFPGHVFCIMRAKTKHIFIKETKEVRKIGVQAIQRKGIGYEFDAVGMMDHEHNLIMDGSRCPFLDLAKFPRPKSEVGHGIAEWLVIGTTETKVEQLKLDDDKVREIRRLFKAIGLSEEEQLDNLTARGYSEIADLPERIANDMIEGMNRHLEEKKKEESYQKMRAAREEKAATSSAVPSSPGKSGSTAQPSKTGNKTVPQTLTNRQMGATIDALMEKESETAKSKSPMQTKTTKK